ncbi:ABC transporter permease subunit [Microbacterium sp. gxy059]|uniref:ABC transporter permease subunit n=1 Tax=Microbacterium sp. gxy059 TaxID=2957199 RepID=UPI003D9A0313
MSTDTATAVPSARERSSATEGARITFGSLVAAERIGLSSLRGNRAALFIGIALVILPSAGLSVLYGTEFRGPDGGAALLEWMPSPAELALNGSIFALAIAVIVGAGAYAKEHATGSLRTQLAAAPRRTGVLGAKALVVGASLFAGSLVAFALALAASAGLSALFGMPIGLGDPFADAVLPVIGTALSVSLVGVFSLGLAALLRSETWTVTLALVFLLVAPMILATLPWEWGPAISELLLGSTSQTLVQTPLEITGDLLRDLALTIGWAAAAFVGGAIAMNRRDA